MIERGGDPLNWVGLWVKVFAFPNSERDIFETYERARDVMRDTLPDHPHIGLCRTGALTNTEDTIDIFRRVAQLGLEGIVIADTIVKYGTKTRETR